MTKDDVLNVMDRELTAIGQYYRNDWSGFDGRTLRMQLNRLSEWSKRASNRETEDDFTDFSEMLTEQDSD